MKAGFLIFDCPNCCCEKAHAIRVPLAPDARVMFPDITIEGLITVKCWRGRVTRGVVSTEL